MSSGRPTQVSAPRTSCSSEWERAYLAFETPRQAKAKIRRRLLRFGADGWQRDDPVVELFCGSGFGLEVLVEMGFADVSGMDLSQELLSRYDGSARCYVGDCRELPFEDGSMAAVIVHGGLHHLDSTASVRRVAAEVRRVLRADGRFCFVEPWRTPFLRLVRRAAGNPLLRRCWSKLDAFQTMVEHELETYERWLSSPRETESVLRESFRPLVWRAAWGGLTFVGQPLPGADCRSPRSRLEGSP